MEAFFILSLWAGWLIHSDLTARRLADGLTLPPAAVGTSVTVALDPALALVGLLWPALYLSTGLLTRGVGGGDLKLAVPLGMLSAAVAGTAGVLCAIALASAISTVTALRYRETPHGPAMLGSCTAVILGAGAFCG